MLEAEERNKTPSRSARRKALKRKRRRESKEMARRERAIYGPSSITGGVHKQEVEHMLPHIQVQKQVHYEENSGDGKGAGDVQACIEPSGEHKPVKEKNQATDHVRKAEDDGVGPDSSLEWYPSLEMRLMLLRAKRHAARALRKECLEFKTHSEEEEESDDSDNHDRRPQSQEDNKNKLSGEMNTNGSNMTRAVSQRSKTSRSGAIGPILRTLRSQNLV